MIGKVGKRPGPSAAQGAGGGGPKRFGCESWAQQTAVM